MMLPHFVLFTNVVHIVHLEEPRAGNKEYWFLLIVLYLTSNVTLGRMFHLWWLLFSSVNHEIELDVVEEDFQIPWRDVLQSKIYSPLPVHRA